METSSTSHFGVELKFYYLHEFIICGLPIPPYTIHPGFILKFNDSESYINYTNALKTILNELESSDPDNVKYEIQRSKAFVKNVLHILRDQYSKKYN